MALNYKRLFLATLFCGVGMWIIAGLWHNLILPGINKDIHPHHEGIGILLIAYFVLAFLMTYFYSMLPKTDKPLINGIKTGVLIGILWVFPHGLAMAGAHETSVLYEIKNTLWHIFEQGIGGIIIAYIYKPGQ